MKIDLPIWPYCYGTPSATGNFRSQAEDFIVTEQLSFAPSGEGEHAFVQIQKTGENTDFIARQLARFADVRQRDIGYAGLKDRYAVATQWFSVWLPGKADPDWSLFASDSIKILQSHRHARKLKRGVLSGNCFVITVRDWQGDKAKTEQQLAAIKAYGIPNYYGSQRFGHEGQNVSKALAMFQGMKAGREQRSLYLSAARSYLFNHILASRVLDGSWNQALAGDTFMFDGAQTCFKSTQPDEEILRRVAEQIIHPSAVLWGKGAPDVAGEALAIEQTIISANQALAEGLEAAGVAKARRALRLKAADLQWQFIEDTVLQLSFSLPAGCYATALLREIIDC
ncbi:tRNA pseudouridine(13) synthase TruD [Methylosoma difficile]